jgi:hypothetical protein
MSLFSHYVRSPVKPNQEVCTQLSEEQRKALEAAVEMAQQYAANPSTAAIWEHLIGLVQQVRVPRWCCRP